MSSKKVLLNTLKVSISIALAVALLYLVFKNIDWIEFWNKAKEVDLTWVIASIVLSIVAYISRAYRWNILLEPLGYRLKTSRTTLAVLVGYLANLAVPRLGEITRCGVLKSNDNVPLPPALGSVVSERIVDLLTLILLFIISLMVEQERILLFLTDAYAGLNLPTGFIFIAAIVLFVFGGLLVFLITKRKTLKGKIGDLIGSFMDGLLSLRNIRRPIGFFVSTLVLWVVYFLMSYIIVFSLPETAHLGFGAGFMLLVTGGIAISIPVQSGFGTYHGMIAGMLLLYGIDKVTGLFLATLLHTSQIVAVALFGSVALIISGLLRKKQQKAD